MADVDTNLYQWSTTEASNKPTGSTSISTNLDDNLRRIQATTRAWLSHKGADIASVAGTTDIGAVEGLAHDITGAETITGFGTVSAGIWKILKYEGAASVTHNATSMILLGGASRTMANGDVQIVISEGSGNWRELAFFAAANQPVKTLQATQATTSGTTVDFTIPAGAKRVTMLFNGVSTDGTENPLIQLGDAGGVENTNYLGASSTLSATAAATTAYTTGFGIRGASADNVLHGSVVLTLLDATNHVWSASGVIAASNAAVTITVSGTKDLDTVLTTVRLTSTNTPDDFDAGSVTVLVE